MPIMLGAAIKMIPARQALPASLARQGAGGKRDTCVESFNGKLRDELLNGEIFYTLLEAKVSPHP